MIIIICRGDRNLLNKKVLALLPLAIDREDANHHIMIYRLINQTLKPSLQRILDSNANDLPNGKDCQ